MLSDYVEVDGEEVPSQPSVELAKEPELSENGVDQEQITCATYCYHTYSDIKQRFASARSQLPLISARLKEKTEYLESTRDFMNDDAHIKAKKQLHDLTTAVDKKNNLIHGLRILLRTFDATDVEQILINHEAELKKLEVDQAAAKAGLAALPKNAAEIRDSRAKVKMEVDELEAQERAWRKELQQCGAEEKALQVWEKVHSLCLCGLSKMKEKDLQVILLNLDTALHEQGGNSHDNNAGVRFL
ncbi:hypothetical protein BHE90_000717 [Fusarium euwallaceae]|uniref:Uncharacterized protein n=1 Tax=Fusarium euwallaceae TaxID=1147111 RepID=A0A430M9R7_9HYPO|nr:hypothetical protein BHE90_000717 [Fusarium euwallaceae]